MRGGLCGSGRVEVAHMGKEAAHDSASAISFAIFKVIVKNCQILQIFACLCAAARVEVA